MFTVSQTLLPNLGNTECLVHTNNLAWGMSTQVFEMVSKTSKACIPSSGMVS